jgi:hypothetical protein
VTPTTKIRSTGAPYPGARGGTLLRSSPATTDSPNATTSKRHIADDAAGYKILLGLLAEYGDSAETRSRSPETSRGQLVPMLRTGKRKVLAINPMAASRCRGRHAALSTASVRRVAGAPEQN